MLPPAGNKRLCGTTLAAGFSTKPGTVMQQLNFNGQPTSTVFPASISPRNNPGKPCAAPSKYTPGNGPRQTTILQPEEEDNHGFAGRAAPLPPAFEG